MRRTVPLLLACVLLGPLTLGACTRTIDQRGFSPTPGSLEKVEVGAQSRDDIVRLIGSPSAIATFNPNVWYYIAQKQESFAFFRPSIIDQQVMQLTFNDSGRLQGIKKYDQADGEHITMVSRITPTAGKELTILEQILGNVGRFSTPQQSNPGAPTSGGGI